MEHDKQVQIDRFYDTALTHDLRSCERLTDEQRFAVVIGGLAPLPLSEEQLTEEWSRLFADGCDLSLTEDILIQMAAYIGYPCARRCLACLADSAPAVGKSLQPIDAPASTMARYERGIAIYK
jgi:hypothetical protein